MLSLQTSSRKSKNEDTYFECERMNHFKKDYFQIKNKGKSSYKYNKKNTTLVIQSDDESEVKVHENDEIARVCFMGIDDESSDKLSEVSTFDYNVLKQENEKLREKNTYLKDLVNI